MHWTLAKESVATPLCFYENGVQESSIEKDNDRKKIFTFWNAKVFVSKILAAKKTRTMVPLFFAEASKKVLCWCLTTKFLIYSHSIMRVFSKRKNLQEY